jgi:hypothetical protein
MGAQEQAHPAGWQAGQEPGLPPRPRRIQPAPPQPGTRSEQLRLIARSGQRLDPDVAGQVEGRRIDPQRPAQPPAGPVQQLPEAGDQVQLRLDRPAYRLDLEAARVVAQPGAIQDG